ncbi:receptor-like protein 12 [Cryptomeria japonica]|uniref:receptor-like protein 12 n=1 Tax=Cryptomeria japonica TaxID=3369 RepID=UPI0027DA45BD|nr:receptor-like protein 12 [Cryptomeria japonica]
MAAFNRFVSRVIKMFWATVPILVLLLHVNGGCCYQPHERDYLLHFKSSLLDPLNQVLNSWHGFNCCEWNGIQCHPHTHHVIRLDLHSSYDARYGLRPGLKRPLSNLSGDVLSPLVNLEQLEHLDLSWNNFSGVPIPPGLDRLKSLRYLDLSWAGFAGDIPTELGNMSTLLYLDLSGYLGLRMVNMRAWWGNMRHLRELILDSVDMSRVESNELDNALSAMYSLTRLQMFVCHLSGGIPPSLANLTNLTHLRLQTNSFNGSIPSSLLSLPRLQHVDLSRNKDLGGNLSSLLPQHSSSLHTLHLYHTAVGGSIPDSVANISSLTVLDLYSCYVESIPSTMANLTALKELDLSGNMLRGQIPPFGDRPSLGRPFPLAYIDLSQNQLDGPIPPKLLTAFPNLQHVDMSYNILTGKIPPLIGQLLSLESLALGNNKLEGAIPLNISNILKLKSLYLYSNRLNGDFSESQLDNLSQLVHVDISNNLLTVKFSPTWIPKFSLQSLGLSSCNMEGGFPTFLITQYEVQIVDLSNNSIAGNIPQWIWGVNSLLFLNLSHNHFAGDLPHSLMGSRLQTLDLHNNNLQGQLPLLSVLLGLLDVSENQLSGSIPAEIGEYRKLGYLSLSRNHLNGSIPPSICQIPWLYFLDLSNNKLTGNIPTCNILACNIPAYVENCTLIEMLNLENNYLEGKLSRQFANMPSLKTLKLGGNGLNSYIPSSLANCKQLEILDLSNNRMIGKIPNWIGQLSNLKVLILRSNRLEDIIPSEITTLPLLQILDLSSNRISGIIPGNISSLQAMKNQTVTGEIFHSAVVTNGSSAGNSNPINVDQETIINKAREMEYARSLALVKSIDLSNNNLTGVIPQNIGLLEGLLILNISRNHIRGEIPKSLGKMVQLESLDLSHSQLSGNIPVELQSLTFLAYLDLSHNHLSGKIPQGGQFYTFEASSFSNNSDLCGLQLNTTCCSLHQNKSCPASIRPEVNVDKVDEEEDDTWWGVGLGISFAVGFSIVIGVLCLTTTWSRKCFQMMDNIIIYLFEKFRK